MKFIFTLAFVCSLSLLFSQSLIKSDYTNMASRGLDVGITKNLENENYILSVRSNTRYRIMNTGLKVSSTLGDSLTAIRNLYITAVAGIGIPLYHTKKSTTTLNANATYNAFDRADNDKINLEFGYEAFLKFNTAFANLELGYSGNPDSDIANLVRKGPYVRLAIGINEFFSRREGFSISNFQRDPNAIILEKGDKVQGSGFALAADGYIVTNYHVVKDGKKIIVTGIDGSKEEEFEAKVIAKDEDADLAIIKINKRLENIPYKFKTKESISGKRIYTLGYPKANVLGSNVKITEGIINATSGIKDDNSVYQISAAITGGNSGGPLFDEYGNIIGITSSGYRDASSDVINYAIKLSSIVPLVEDTDKVSITTSDFNSTEVDASIISNEYGKFVYVITVEH